MSKVSYIKFNKLNSGSDIARNRMTIQHFFELLPRKSFSALSLKNKIKNILQKTKNNASKDE
jgi:hypothetical protein